MNQEKQAPVASLFPYRVLDLSNEWGLLCGKILSDMGADVIKIEPPGGDPARNNGPYYQNSNKPQESLFWFAFNTNKKSITLDIESIQGQDILKKLVQSVDFVIESFKPGYMEKLGLSYDDLSKINPGIIMVSVSPFGQTGPFADYKATDMVVTALGLLMNQCGESDRPPVKVGFPQSYVNAGADAAMAAMIAHRHRKATGEGQHIDVSAMEGIIWSGSEVLPEFFVADINSSRVGMAFKRPNGLYTPVIWECKDGYISFLLIAGTPGLKANKGLLELLKEDGIAPDYLINKVWEDWDWETTTQKEIESVVKPFAEYFKRHTKEEIFNETAKRGISCYPVTDAADIMAEPQLKARNFWIEVDHDELNNKIPYPGPFAVFSKTPIKPYRRAPLIGENNRDIYENELGLDKDTIAKLQANKVI